MGKRKKTPKEIEANVLVESARRCALCFGFEGDLSRKKGQIAHIDQNPANANEENLVYLCVDHHDEYDSTTRQTKNVTEQELAEYKKRLVAAIGNGDHTITDTAGVQNTSDVSSTGQTGGVTAGNIETLNINSSQSSDSQSALNQLKRDAQTALMYQTEILHFLQKFKMLLHWSLPLGEQTDIEIDSVFNYGANYIGAIDVDNVSTDLVANIFMRHDFSQAMPNYAGAPNFHPTGFDNLLGIMGYMDQQLEKHLNKYGSTTSAELTTRIEYMQRTVQSATTRIRLDLLSTGNIASQTSKLFGDFIVRQCDDLDEMKKEYTKHITGGMPVLIGKVTKSHKTQGELLVETQFSSYRR